jgi:arabinogalactan oligomer/maltooligosaccharide transport system permease protein
MASVDRSLDPSLAAVPSQSFWARTKRTRTAYFYLLPALVVMAVITFYPILYQFYMSFTDFGPSSINPTAKTYKPPTYVGFQNYQKILTNDLKTVDADLANFNFWRTLGFNIWWTFSNVIFHVSLGIVIAVLLNIEGLWFKKIYRAIYILPMVLPQLVIATIWRNMFDGQAGAVNLALKAILGPVFGPEHFNIEWFRRIEDVIPGLPLSYFALLITNIWLGWPFMTIVATGALQSIPKELYEAASIDGATAWQQFWRITLPLLRPAMVPATILGIITTFNLFHVIYFVSEGGPIGKTEILVTQGFKLINGNSLFGYGAAFSVFIFIILGFISAITAKISRVAEEYDA